MKRLSISIIVVCIVGIATAVFASQPEDYSSTINLFQNSVMSIITTIHSSWNQ